MSASQWLGIAVVVVLAGCIFLGMRGGRRQYRADRQELAASSYAQGARDMEASLRAQLTQSVTVVAGNHGTGHDGPTDSDQQPDRVLEWIRAGVAVPAVEASEALSESPEAHRLAIAAGRVEREQAAMVGRYEMGERVPADPPGRREADHWDMP